MSCTKQCYSRTCWYLYLNVVAKHLPQVTDWLLKYSNRVVGVGEGSMYLIILWIFWDELRTACCHLWPAQKDATLLMESTVTYVSVNQHVLRDNKRAQIYLPQGYKSLNLSRWTFYSKNPKPLFSKLNINPDNITDISWKTGALNKDVPVLALKCHQSLLK